MLSRPKYVDQDTRPPQAAHQEFGLFCTQHDHRSVLAIALKFIAFQLHYLFGPALTVFIALDVLIPDIL